MSTDDKLRSDLAVAHRLASHHGFDELVWNHLSVRNGDNFLITPGRKSFACMRPEDIADTKSLTNVTASVIHGAIYQARPDVGAIVHSHTDATVFVSCLPGSDPLQLFTQDGGAFYNKVAYHDFEGVADDFGEQQRIASDFGTSAHTLIMRNHGAVTVGKTIAEAFVRMFYLDRVCTAQMDQMKAGAGSKPLSQEILQKMAQQYENPDFEHGSQEWEGLVEFATQHLGCSWTCRNDKASKL